MFEVKGNLLMFNKLDKMGFIFPKNCCNVNIPDFVPVLHPNSDDFMDKPIGFITSYNKDGNSKNGLSVIINTSISFNDEEVLRELISNGCVYFGGHYNNIKKHKENGITIVQSIDLVAVGLYFGDVYGNDDLRLEVLQND